MQVYPAHPTQAKPPPGAPPATFEELTADLAGVPDGLCAATRWLLWRYEWRPAEGKWTKVPISAETGRPADGTPPDTGLTLYDALAQAERLRDKEVTVSGVGIALGDGLAGVDLDKCLEAGALAPWAQAVVDRLGSWAEESVSATGVHILCAGALPPGRRRTGQIEMYDAGRFFTVTGRQLAGTPVTVQERTAELGAWHAEVFPPAPAAPERPASPLGDDDESVLRRCRDNRKTGAHFDRLWNGDLSDHGGDESAADLALCNYLRFYSGDRGQVERLWGNSALGRRDKWQRQDYRAWTLDKAMRGDVYTPPPPVGTNGRAHPAPAADPVTLAQVVATFQQWLYLEDLGPVYAALAAVAANRMAGDPVWLMMVGASSGGKTEIINAITKEPDVHPAATLTEAALLSGTPKRDKAAGAKGGLLRQIGDFGILAVKDFTSILSMNRDPRAMLLAALREIFDGAWTRHVGIDGGVTLAWQGKIGLLAGCTAAIDSYHQVVATMGERFLLYRLPEIDAREQARRALRNTGREREMRAALAGAVSGLFASLTLPESAPELEDDETDRLVALASLAARSRSGVERDSRTREIELILDPEAPARIAQTLRRLYGGLLVIGLDRPTAWKCVAKIGLDCMPKLRRGVFDALAAVAPDTWLGTSALAAHVAYPTITARRGLEDLMVHGVVERQEEPRGGSHLWRLTRWAWEQYCLAGGVSEMSVPPNGEEG